MKNKASRTVAPDDSGKASPGNAFEGGNSPRGIPPGDRLEGSSWGRVGSGSLRILARPQMEERRLGEGRGRVSMAFYVRKPSQNIAKTGPIQSQQSFKNCGYPWKSGLADR